MKIFIFQLKFMLRMIYMPFLIDLALYLKG